LFARQSLYNHNSRASASFLLPFSRFFYATAGLSKKPWCNMTRHDDIIRLRHMLDHAREALKMAEGKEKDGAQKRPDSGTGFDQTD